MEAILSSDRPLFHVEHSGVTLSETRGHLKSTYKFLPVISGEGCSQLQLKFWS